MAFLMSIAFSLPVYYLCKLQGSFFIVWLVWLVSLADGIGDYFTSLHAHISIPVITLSGRMRMPYTISDGLIPAPHMQSAAQPMCSGM